MEEEDERKPCDSDVRNRNVKPSDIGELPLTSINIPYQTTSFTLDSEEMLDGNSSTNVSNHCLPQQLQEKNLIEERCIADISVHQGDENQAHSCSGINRISTEPNETMQQNQSLHKNNFTNNTVFNEILEAEDSTTCSDTSPQSKYSTTLTSVDNNSKEDDYSCDSFIQTTVSNEIAQNEVEVHSKDAILSELDEALYDFRSRDKNHLNSDSHQQYFDSPIHNMEHASQLEQTISGLQMEIEKMRSDMSKSRDDHYVEVQALERALSQERLRIQQQEDLASKTISQLKHNLEKRQQLLDTANKDRESMVVKYAVSEKSVINLRRDLETAERKLKDANRSRDLLSERLRVVQLDKEKANNLLETKGQELSMLNRENQRLKEDLRWTQNKLKSESESKKDAEHRITGLIRKVEESRLQVEQAHKDAQAAIKSFQESQENRAVILDQQLREQQAQLILERHERADSEGTFKQLQLEVETLKKKQQTLINENNQLSLKVQTLEKERLEGDQRVSRLKQDSDSHHQEVAELRERLAEMESLRVQLQHYEDQIATCRSEMERLRQANSELQQDASACREREAELLDFTQKLTEKNVRLQSEFSALEAKAQMLENEHLPLTRKLTEAETRVATLSNQLEDEQKERQEENSLLARHLAEKTHRAQQLQQQLEDCQGEIEVMKRKHAASLRELTRELQHVHKRQENSENNGSGSTGSGSTSLGQESRASSTSSLNNVCETPQSPSIPTIVFPNGMEPDKQVLIERLVKLQRENAKKAEKLDFLEEHNQTLLSELQKKSRVIQSYVMRVPAGALSSDSMDQNKAELAKRSGIMASMYGSRTDEAMTLELSMEINRKLQAVLEDTLLKNITLKENIDTLGSEIARLSKK